MSVHASIDCKTCRATGAIEVTEMRGGYPWATNYKDCEKCNGTGQVFECKTCFYTFSNSADADDCCGI